MRVKVGFVAVAVVLALLGFALAGAVAHGALSIIRLPYAHTCPSDHHTYVWTDTNDRVGLGLRGTGRARDRPGSGLRARSSTKG